MRLGSKHRSHLVHPLEDPDEHLLVELRRLRQIGLAPEVVDAEDVRPGLGRRLDELRTVHLGVTRGVQGRPETVERDCRELPLRLLQGCLHVTGPWSSMVGRPAVIFGRQSSIGGVTATSDVTAISGSMISTPPGAAGSRWSVPTTSTVVSSLIASTAARVSSSRTTTCAVPDRSRMTTNARPLSRRRRWTQPLTRTGSPEGKPETASAKVRGNDRECGDGSFFNLQVCEARRCGRRANSRCHHTFTVASRRPHGCRLRGVFVAGSKSTFSAIGGSLGFKFPAATRSRRWRLCWDEDRLLSEKEIELLLSSGRRCRRGPARYNVRVAARGTPRTGPLAGPG